MKILYGKSKVGRYSLTYYTDFIMLYTKSEYYTNSNDYYFDVISNRIKLYRCYEPIQPSLYYGGTIRTYSATDRRLK